MRFFGTRPEKRPKCWRTPTLTLWGEGSARKAFGDVEDGGFGSWLDSPPPGHGSHAQGCGGGGALSKKLGGERHGIDLIGLREAERAREMERTVRKSSDRRRGSTALASKGHPDLEIWWSQWLHHGGSILFSMATKDESSTSMIWWRKRPGEEEEEEEEEEEREREKPDRE